ncbi:phage major capsid protein, HK97 family [Prevotella sp. KH2C16]|nr:phage major capsid protein, HK97 family [Prevotella sp. KH2C16]
MKEKRAAAQKKMEELLNGAKKESRALNADETAEFESLKEEVRMWTDRIDQLEDFLSKQKPQKKTSRKFSYVQAIRSLVENREFEAPEAEVSKVGARSSVRTGEGRSLFIPMEKRAALQATLAEQGIEDVATDLLDLVTPLENELIAARAGATFLAGLQGNIDIPFYTGTTAGWAGEVEAAADGSGKFKKKTLSPKRITGYVDLSRQLLIQSNDSIEAYIQSSLVEAVRQTLEGTMFSADDAADNKPAGLLNGVVAQTAAPTYGLLVDAETVLYKNNFRSLNWVGAYDALGILKKTEKVAGQPVYLYEGGLIDGRPVYGSNNVASKGLILGDFSELTIGQWGGIEVTVDPYTQALNGTVRLIVNAYFDYFVRRGYDKKGDGIVPFEKIILK